MTTPVAPTGQQYVLGGGSLAGTNVLQSSIDTLDASVKNLNTTISNLTSAIQGTSGGGSSLAGRGTRQQGAGLSSGFPSMINPFQSSSQQLGIGGGGPGGAGNISSINTFRSNSFLGSAAGAILGFSAQNSMNLINLNQYATSSMIGLNYNGMSRNQAMTSLYAQAGMGGNGYNNLALSQADALNSIGVLQQRAGSQLVRQTALGRSAIGYQSQFGVMNPALGATQSANIASAILSPTFSLNMMTLGYKPILSPGGGSTGPAQAAMSILQSMNLNGRSAKDVYGNLMSGKGQANLSYLFGPSGVSNSAAQQWLTGIATLSVNDRMSANQINNLFTQAATGNPTQRRAAMAKLSQAGISTAGNDISSLVGNQAVISNRMGSYAGGFNQGLQDATGLLSRFNQILSEIVNGPIGTAIGYGGGLGGTLAGASNALGIFSSAAVLKSLRGSGASSRMLGTSLGSELGAAEGAALTSSFKSKLLGTVGTAGLGLLISQLIEGQPSAAKHQVMGQPTLFGMQPTSNAKSGWYSWSGFGKNLGNWFWHDPVSWFLSQNQPGTNSRTTQASPGGGASATIPNPGTTQQSSNPTQGMTGSISAAARKAVGAAESQLGVPYVFGDEAPGVGFDCSGLTQWAYKQAGVSLPRTAAQQWSSLSKRSVPLGSVQEGDLVFAAGSDGSIGAPGHVGLMISANKLIEAPHTGTDVQIISYNPRDWQHAGRPSGSGSFIGGQVASSIGSSGNSLFAGDRGRGGGFGGAYGSVNEVDIINAMGGGAGRGAGFGGITNGSSGSTSTLGGTNTTASPSSGGGIGGGGSPSSNQALGQRLAAGRGWTGSEWDALNKLWTRESGWSNTIWNGMSHAPTLPAGSSGAYGIAQSLPYTKYPKAGWPPGYGGRADPRSQIQWGLDYISSVYGDPINAWSHEQAVSWYGAGGPTLPGLSIVGDRGPELMFTGGGNQVFSNAQTMAFINAIKGAAPAQSPWKTDITSGGSKTSAAQSIQVNFSQGSIQFNNSGTSKSEASSAGREVARQIVKHINSEAMTTAIRRGEKL